MAKPDDYKLYRLINGGEVFDYDSAEEFRSELADLILCNSLIAFSARKVGEALVVEIEGVVVESPAKN